MSSGNFIQSTNIRRALTFMAEEFEPMETDEVCRRAVENYGGQSDETMRRAINDGVQFGVFRKVAGRNGRQTGEVQTTTLGRWWFDLKLLQEGADHREPQDQKRIQAGKLDELLFNFNENRIQREAAKRAVDLDGDWVDEA